MLHPVTDSTIHQRIPPIPLLGTYWLPSGWRTFTHYFFSFWWNLIDSHELHAFYLDMHQDARQYKKKMRDVNTRRRIKGKPPFRRRTVEMDNFQDPQVFTIRYQKFFNQSLQCFYRYRVINLSYGNLNLFNFVFWLTVLHKDMNRLWKM